MRYLIHKQKFAVAITTKPRIKLPYNTGFGWYCQLLWLEFWRAY